MVNRFLHPLDEAKQNVVSCGLQGVKIWPWSEVKEDLVRYGAFPAAAKTNHCQRWNTIQELKETVFGDCAELTV